MRNNTSMLKVIILPPERGKTICLSQFDIQSYFLHLFLRLERFRWYKTMLFHFSLYVSLEMLNKAFNLHWKGTLVGSVLKLKIPHTKNSENWVFWVKYEVKLVGIANHHPLHHRRREHHGYHRTIQEDPSKWLVSLIGIDSLSVLFCKCAIGWI